MNLFLSQTFIIELKFLSTFLIGFLLIYILVVLTMNPIITRDWYLKCCI